MVSSSDAGRIGIWGRSGSGKSSYVKAILNGRKRVLVFDPLDEYKKEGFKAIRHGPANLNASPLKRHTGGIDAVRQAILENYKDFRLAYIPTAGHEPATLSGICRILIAAQIPFLEGKQKAQITLVIEEMNLSFRNPQGLTQCPAFAEICSRGRHFGIEVIGLSQRLSEVSMRFRGNTTEAIVFAQSTPTDHDAGAAALGFRPKNFEDLKNLQFMRKTNEGLERGEVRFFRNRPKIKID
jgi:hypothetical protein